MTCLNTEAWRIVFRDKPLGLWGGTHIDGSDPAIEIGEWRGTEAAKKGKYVYAYCVETVPPRLLTLWDPEYLKEGSTDVGFGTDTITYVRGDADGDARVIVVMEKSGRILNVLFDPTLGDIALLYRLPAPAYEEVVAEPVPQLAVATLAEEIKPLVVREQGEQTAAASSEGRGDWGPVPIIEPLDPTARAMALTGLIRYAIFPSVLVGEARKTDTTRGVATFTAPWAVETMAETITVYDETAFAFEIWLNGQASEKRLPPTYCRAPATKGHLCIPVAPGDGESYLEAAKTLRRSGHENVFTKTFTLQDNNVVFGAKVICAEDARNRRLFMWITGTDKRGNLADAGTIMLSANAQIVTDMNTRE